MLSTFNVQNHKHLRFIATSICFVEFKNDEPVKSYILAFLLFTSPSKVMFGSHDD